MVHPLRSLTGKFLLLLLPVTLGFSAVLFWVLSEHTFHDQQRELRYNLEGFVALQASTLGPALWNYDVGAIRALFQAYSLNPDVDRVFLYDAEGTEVARTLGISGHAVDPRLTHEQNIYYTDRDRLVPVGRISASFRDDRLRLERDRLFRSNLIILTGLFLLISVATALITRQTIGKPLQRLRRSLDKAANDTREPVRWKSADELGQVVAAYNSLLARQAAAEAEIQRYQGHLEDLVAQQTKDLRQESDMLTSVLRQLGERQAYMRAIFDHAGIGIVTLDPDGVAIEANQHFCQIVARELESWDIDDLGGFVHASDRSDFVSGLSQLSAGRSVTFRQEVRLVRPGGEIRWCDLAATGVVGEDGTVLLSVMVLSDVTVRRQAEDQMAQARRLAEEANRAKNDFLANMSHEIRTPMNAVIGLSQLALQGDLPPRQRDYVQKIADSSHTLLGIINEILDFSAIEAGRMTLDAVEFRPDEIFREVAASVGRRARDKGLDFAVEIAPDLPPHLIGDPARLRQILVNLCGNAVKFTPAGSVATMITWTPAGPGEIVLSIVVSDTGIGMSDAQKSRLFEAFAQADSSTTRRFGGTGLGLVICKSLVDMMGGQITVDSAEGQGACFGVTVPFRLGADGRRSVLAATVDHGACGETIEDGAGPDADALRDLYVQLRVHLLADDTDAVPLAMDLAARTRGTAFAEVGARIEAMVGRYDFIGALDAIEILESSLGMGANLGPEGNIHD